MLNTIDDYVDHIAKLHGWSDRDICRALNMKSNGISHWRNKRTWPSEVNMIALCRLGNLDATRGLLMLAQWRSEGEATPIWAKLAATVAVLAVLLLMPVDRAQASTRPELGTGASVYYGKWRRFLRRVRLFVSDHIQTALVCFPETNRPAHA